MGIYQSLTFRLFGSIPQKIIQQFREELENVDAKLLHQEMKEKIEEALAQGMGYCAFKHDELAGVMQEALFHFDGERYDLIAWCIMPNHVHVLIRVNDQLAKIINSWKSFVGKYALSNRRKFGIEEDQKSFWLREYWDRYIRNENHLLKTINYIHQNPVKAGLCSDVIEWKWSSAYNGK
ncbi:hypothetical protein LNTAR_12776 [Lentisphaera araneosa HTCC2155]|uniref:Transposase IS200-like domain-containing protein n=1 Tax=Lentisphaera araneosa HTCC2155 TaxID=313628 RepID=A6DK06_9BACT|nr:transposase [Lentisphaera araneosa]EDM28230.1 hypothetical protein LNTAR_12776 [Lentisphaera araneosa HTCC2155]